MAATCQGATPPAAAADLRIENAVLRNANESAHAAVCTEGEFLRPGCTRFGSARALAGVPTVAGAPPGTHTRAVHVEDEDGALDRPGFRPTEGSGFSREALMRFGPARREDARFKLTQGGATVPFTLRCFQ